MKWFKRQNKVNQGLIVLIGVSGIIIIPLLCLCNIILLAPSPPPIAQETLMTATVEPTVTPQPTMTATIEPTVAPTDEPVMLSFDEVVNHAMSLDDQARQQYLEGLKGFDIAFRGAFVTISDNDTNGTYLVSINVETDERQCSQMSIVTDDKQRWSVEKGEVVSGTAIILGGFMFEDSLCPDGGTDDTLIIVTSHERLQ